MVTTTCNPSLPSTALEPSTCKLKRLPSIRNCHEVSLFSFQIRMSVKPKYGAVRCWSDESNLPYCGAFTSLSYKRLVVMSFTLHPLSPRSSSHLPLLHSSFPTSYSSKMRFFLPFAALATVVLGVAALPSGTPADVVRGCFPQSVSPLTCGLS